MELSPFPVYKTHITACLCKIELVLAAFPRHDLKNHCVGTAQQGCYNGVDNPNSHLTHPNGFALPSHKPEMELVLENKQQPKIKGPDLVVTGVQNKIKSIFLAFTDQFFKSFYLPLEAPVLSYTRSRMILIFRCSHFLRKMQLLAYLHLHLGSSQIRKNFIKIPRCS